MRTISLRHLFKEVTRLKERLIGGIYRRELSSDEIVAIGVWQEKQNKFDLRDAFQYYVDNDYSLKPLKTQIKKRTKKLKTKTPSRSLSDFF